MDEQTVGRLRRHRGGLAEQGWKRLEVTIGSDVIGELRAIVKRKGWPLWRPVQTACKDYVRVFGNSNLPE
jgi:hypothetical protein